MAFEEEINDAIGAHSVWKMKLRTAIAVGKADANVHDVAKDDACAFGQWLYSPALSPAVRASSDYLAVRRLHADFHKCAAKVLECIRHADKAQANAQLEGEYERVSNDLMAALRKWKRAAH